MKKALNRNIFSYVPNIPVSSMPDTSVIKVNQSTEMESSGGGMAMASRGLITP